MANDGIITATLDVYVTERGAYKDTLICSDPVDYKETVPPYQVERPDEAHASRNLRKPSRR